MQNPLQISFHGLDRSEALEADVRKHVAKLEEFCDRVTGCQVVLEKPHKRHRRGNLYHVRIRVAVPRRELVVDREPAGHHAHEDPYVTVRDAFKAMRRQLEDYVREIRGDVKAKIAPAAPETSPSRAISPLPTEETIRLRAYELWEAAGRPEGDGVPFWLEAERERQQPV